MLDTNDLKMIEETFRFVFSDIKTSIDKIHESISTLIKSDHTIELALQNEVNERKSCHSEHGAETNIIHSKIRETNVKIDDLKKKIENFEEAKRSWPTRLYESVSKIGRMILLICAVIGVISGGLLAMTTFLAQFGIIKIGK